MARNPYFRDYSGEQNVVEDLTIEKNNEFCTAGRSFIHFLFNLVMTINSKLMNVEKE